MDPCHRGCPHSLLTGGMSVYGQLCKWMVGGATVIIFKCSYVYVGWFSLWQKQNLQSTASAELCLLFLFVLLVAAASQLLDLEGTRIDQVLIILVGSTPTPLPTTKSNLQNLQRSIDLKLPQFGPPGLGESN